MLGHITNEAWRDMVCANIEAGVNATLPKSADRFEVQAHLAKVARNDKAMERGLLRRVSK